MASSSTIGAVVKVAHFDTAPGPGSFMGGYPYQFSNSIIKNKVMHPNADADGTLLTGLTHWWEATAPFTSEGTDPMEGMSGSDIIGAGFIVVDHPITDADAAKISEETILPVLAESGQNQAVRIWWTDDKAKE